MGLGSTAKKLQQMADLSKELYGRMNELRDQVVGVRDAVDDTSERVDAIEIELDEQRAILEALAVEQGVDVETVVAPVDDADSSGDGPADGEPADAEGATPTDEQADAGEDAPTAGATDGGDV